MRKVNTVWWFYIIKNISFKTTIQLLSLRMQINKTNLLHCTSLHAPYACGWLHINHLFKSRSLESITHMDCKWAVGGCSRMISKQSRLEIPNAQIKDGQDVDNKKNKIETLTYHNRKHNKRSRKRLGVHWQGGKSWGVRQE